MEKNGSITRSGTSLYLAITRPIFLRHASYLSLGWVWDVSEPPIAESLWGEETLGSVVVAVVNTSLMVIKSSFIK